MDSELTQDEIDSLKISDFHFSFIDRSDQKMCEKIKAFITRHEWLGKMPLRPTHRFIATYTMMAQLLHMEGMEMVTGGNRSQVAKEAMVRNVEIIFQLQKKKMIK